MSSSSTSRCPTPNGLEAGRQIKQARRSVKLVFLTMNEDADGRPGIPFRRLGLSAPRSAASELATAIREVMQGRTYITPLVAEGLVGSLLRAPTTARATTDIRQREVLQFSPRAAR
jgi:DNA-binding NarL/FixJ family response regulator